MVQFSHNERNLVVQAMGQAEEHTSRYYCIPPFRWQELRYDLLTCQDREWEPLPEDALARVQPVRRVTRKRPEPFDFYRIMLNDAGILTAAARENLHDHLYSFLVYILTHEMVHLVRLSTILDDMRELLGSEEREERRVQAISRKILSTSGFLEFQFIFEKFCISRPAPGNS